MNPCPICYSERNICQVSSSITMYCDKHLLVALSKATRIVNACPIEYRENDTHKLDCRLLKSLQTEIDKRGLSSGVRA